jgi:hypothetical protein
MLYRHRPIRLLLRNLLSVGRETDIFFKPSRRVIITYHDFFFLSPVVTRHSCYTSITVDSFALSQCCRYHLESNRKCLLMLRIQLVTASTTALDVLPSRPNSPTMTVPITSTDSPNLTGDVLRRRVTSGGQTFESESGSGRRRRRYEYRTIVIVLCDRARLIQSKRRESAVASDWCLERVM